MPVTGWNPLGLNSAGLPVPHQGTTCACGSMLKMIAALPRNLALLLQKMCWEEPERQKTRSCRAQELSRSRAQENARQKKNPLLDPVKNRRLPGPLVSPLDLRAGRWQIVYRKVAPER